MEVSDCETDENGLTPSKARVPSAAAARIESPAEREERRAVSPSARCTVAELGKHGGSVAIGFTSGEGDEGGGGVGGAEGGGGATARGSVSSRSLTLGSTLLTGWFRISPARVTDVPANS